MKLGVIAAMDLELQKLFSTTTKDTASKKYILYL